MVASLLSLADNYRRVGKVHWPKGKSPSAQTGRQRTSTWPMSTFPDLFLSGPTALNARCEHKKEGKRIVRAEVFCHVAARTNSLPKESAGRRLIFLGIIPRDVSVCPAIPSSLERSRESQEKERIIGQKCILFWPDYLSFPGLLTKNSSLEASLIADPCDRDPTARHLFR